MKCFTVAVCTTVQGVFTVHDWYYWEYLSWIVGHLSTENKNSTSLITNHSRYSISCVYYIYRTFLFSAEFQMTTDSTATRQFYCRVSKHSCTGENINHSEPKQKTSITTQHPTVSQWWQWALQFSELRFQEVLEIWGCSGRNCSLHSLERSTVLAWGCRQQVLSKLLVLPH